MRTHISLPSAAGNGRRRIQFRGATDADVARQVALYHLIVSSSKEKINWE